jgi:ClpP class serine protease
MSAVETITSNFWIILVFLSIIYPRFQQSVLRRARNSALSTIGRKRGSNVITLIHRQETLSFLGLPISRYIDIDDSEDILRAIRLTDDDAPIDIIIHTPGGIALAATQIAFALKEHKGKTAVIVPHYAMSGGTLIALAADEILMDPHAVLGPIDPQISTQKGTYAATSIIKVVDRKKPEDIDDETLYLAEEAKKAINQMRDTLKKLIQDKYGEEKTEEIIEALVSGRYTHDFPITAEATCDMFGECAITDLPREVYKLMNLYKMDRQRRPGVEYVPIRQSSF